MGGHNPNKGYVYDMDYKPPRRWFQLAIYACLVVVCVAALVGVAGLVSKLSQNMASFSTTVVPDVTLTTPTGEVVGGDFDKPSAVVESPEADLQAEDIFAPVEQSTPVETSKAAEAAEVKKTTESRKVEKTVEAPAPTTQAVVTPPPPAPTPTAVTAPPPRFVTAPPPVVTAPPPTG